MDKNSGSIIARRIFRLLWDEEEQRPVLFLEKVYPENAPMAEVIEKYAITRARSLALDLYVCGQQSCNLQSLASPAPYEYADAAAAIEEGGNFTIFAAEKVYDRGQAL